MAMMPCRECSKPISVEAKTCPHCGAPRLPPSGGALMLAWAAGVFVVLLGVGAWITGKGGALPFLPRNAAPPAYIKSVAAYKDGSDAISVYFVLVDKAGARTTADGTLDLKIVETRRAYYDGDVHEEEIKLLEERILVRRDAFVLTQIGAGAFERDELLYPIGRIPYTRFATLKRETLGKVKLTFTTRDGRQLYGEETVFF